MKLKNINFVERHVEKAVIAVAFCVLAYAVYHWGLGTPYKVPLANKTVTSGEVDKVILEHASILQSAIDTKEVHPELADLKPRITRIDTLLNQPLMVHPENPTLPLDVFAIAFNELIPGQPITVFDAEERYTPKIPAPEVVAQDTTLRTIDPNELAANTELAKVFVNVDEADLPTVTVTGQFNMLEMIKQLLHQPEDNSVLPLPEDWWMQTWMIVDVQLERQEMNADGTWPAEDQFTLVPPLPGTVSFRGVPDHIPPADALKYLEVIQQYRAVILQPAAPETVERVWIPPQPKSAKQIAEEGKQGEIRAEIADKQKVIDTLLKKVQQLRNQGTPAPAGGATGGGIVAPGFEGGAIGPRPGVTPRRTTTPRPSVSGAGAASARQKLAERYEQRIAKIQEEINALNVEYAKLTGGKTVERQRTRLDLGPGGYPGDFGGEFPGGFPGEGGIAPGGIPRGGDPRFPGGADPRYPRGGDPRFPGGQPLPGVGGVPAPGGQLTPNDPNAPPISQMTREEALATNNGGLKVDMWAYDITVEEGKTYRYRMSVRVMNPLYNKQNLPGDPNKLKPEEFAKTQRGVNHDLFLISSKPSEWGEPIAVHRMGDAFAVSSSPNPRPGQVTFEVWRFAQGKWRTKEFTCRAGDPIGQPAEIQSELGPIEVDFSTGMVCLDIDFDFAVEGQIAGLIQKKHRVLMVDGDEVRAVRVDLDKDNPRRDELKKEAAADVVALTR